MGSFDEAEVCGLVELYLLHIPLTKFGKESIGLYSDDGLSCFETHTGPALEKIKKKLRKIFKGHWV